MSDPRAARVEVLFAAEAHSPDAIQRAAYRFADRCSVHFARDGANFLCELSFADAVDSQVVREFEIAVNDEVLRERIRDETRDVRNLILALAFANTGLVQDTPEP